MIQLKLMMAADRSWAIVCGFSVLAGFHILLLKNFMSFFEERKFYELLLEPT